MNKKFNRPLGIIIKLGQIVLFSILTIFDIIYFIILIDYIVKFNVDENSGAKIFAVLMIISAITFFGNSVLKSIRKQTIIKN